MKQKAKKGLKKMAMNLLRKIATKYLKKNNCSGKPLSWSMLSNLCAQIKGQVACGATVHSVHPGGRGRNGQGKPDSVMGKKDEKMQTYYDAVDQKSGRLVSHSMGVTTTTTPDMTTYETLWQKFPYNPNNEDRCLLNDSWYTPAKGCCPKDKVTFGRHGLDADFKGWPSCRIKVRIKVQVCSGCACKFPNNAVGLTRVTGEAHLVDNENKPTTVKPGGELNPITAECESFLVFFDGLANAIGQILSTSITLTYFGAVFGKYAKGTTIANQRCSRCIDTDTTSSDCFNRDPSKPNGIGKRNCPEREPTKPSKQLGDVQGRRGGANVGTAASTLIGLNGGNRAGNSERLL